MPIELTDEQGNELDLDKADGGTLRRKLEEALSENRTLYQENSTFKASKAIEEHGLSLVKPEDLAGVAADQLEAKARELQEQREGERQNTVRSLLAERGFEGDDLESAIKTLLGGESAEESGSGLKELSALGGSRPGHKPDAPPLDDSMGNLTSYFEDKESSSRK